MTSTADNRGKSETVSREAAKLVMDDAYRSKAMYERAQNEVNRLRGILDQTIHDIANEGYAAWSSRLHQEVYGDD